MENSIIKHVHIEGLWNKYTVDFPLDEDVNILVGNNGVGKTTILNILFFALREGPQEYGERKSIFDSVEILLTNDYSVTINSVKRNKILRWWHQGELIEDGRSLPVWSSGVSSFDVNFFEDSYLRKLKSVHTDIKTELDARLYNVIDWYYRYQSMLGASLRELVNKGETEKVPSLYAIQDNAQRICNNLFVDKVWYENEKTEGKLLFQTKEDGVVLNPSQLSSGEKQLLILLLSTLVSNGRRCIVFWDEPEISLHIDWQEHLISTMRELNPNMQLIIATHSPSILFEGWEQRAINVNSIKTKA